MCIAYIVYYYICLPLCENTHKIIILWVIIILVKICSSICTWLSLQTDYAIQPNLTPLYRGIKNWHNSSAKSGRLIGCTPGPRVIFCAGAFGDSSPSLAFPRREKLFHAAFQVTPRLCAQGHQRPLAFARFSAQGMRYSLHRKGPMLPWMSERAESSAHGSRWCVAGIMWMRGCTLPTVATKCWAGIMWMRECPLHMADCSWGAGIVWKIGQCLPNPAAADEGLVSCEWECPLHTADPSWGAGIVWIREQCLPNLAAADEGLVSCEWECPLHTADPSWGAGIMWIREQCLPNLAAADEGLVSCEWVRSQVIMHCTRQNTALGQGAAFLDSGFFRVASAATWETLAPVSALGSPLRHWRGTWEAGLMSWPAGSMGERNADI